MSITTIGTFIEIFDMDNNNCSKLFTQHTAFTWDDVKLNEE